MPGTVCLPINSSRMGGNLRRKRSYACDWRNHQPTATVVTAISNAGLLTLISSRGRGTPAITVEGARGATAIAAVVIVIVARGACTTGCGGRAWALGSRDHLRRGLTAGRARRNPLICLRRMSAMLRQFRRHLFHD